MATQQQVNLLRAKAREVGMGQDEVFDHAETVLGYSISDWAELRDLDNDGVDRMLILIGDE